MGESRWWAVMNGNTFLQLAVLEGTVNTGLMVVTF